MANEGEIRVQARLATDKLAGDLRSASGQIQQQINTASSAYSATRENVQRRLQAEELRAHRAAGLRGYNVQEFFGQRGRFAAPYTGPTPPVIPPPKLPGFLAGVPARAPAGISALGALGIPYVSTLTRAVFSPLGLAITASVLALMNLRRAIHSMIEAAERASRFYAKSLTSGGMPLGFVTHKSLVANALGVGEDEVFQYGAAFTVLNEKFASASRLIAGATPRLTAMNWEMKAAQAQFQAITMAVAAEFAPAMQRIAFLIRGVGQTIEPLVPYIAQTIKNGVANAFRIAFGGGFLVDIIKQALRLVPANEAPTPEAWMKRLPTSAWERMGLVLGGGSDSDSPERATAKNTKTLVDVANRILGVIAGAIPGGAISEILPRGNHGMHGDFMRNFATQSP